MTSTADKFALRRIDRVIKLKHWRGFQAENARKAAPVLEFALPAGLTAISVSRNFCTAPI